METTIQGLGFRGVLLYCFFGLSWPSFSEDPPPCNTGTIEILEDPNIILIIHNGHYYWVAGST